MHKLSVISWLPLCLVVSCSYLEFGSSGLNLKATEQKRLERLLVDREYVLSSTVTGTDFFGQSDRYFVDARPFEILTFKRHTGDLAPVRMETKVSFPAGTPVVLKKILYPLSKIEGALDETRDPHHLAPTAHAWLALENTSREGAKTQMVMVLPYNIDGPKQLEKEIRKRLKSPMWVSTWLSHRSPAVLNAIYQKNLIEGMSRPEVNAALGTPRNEAKANGNEMLFEADYGDLQVLFEGNVITRIRSLKIEAEVARIEAEAKAKQAKKQAEQEQRLAEEAAAQKALEEAEKEKARALLEKKHQDKLAKLEQKRKRAVAATQQARRAQLVETASVQAATRMPAKALDLDAEAAKTEASPSTQPMAQPFTLGARVRKLTKTLFEDLKLKRGTKGVFVSHIRARGSALRMGLLENDVITNLNGESISSPEELAKILRSLAASSQVTISVLRNQKNVVLTNF